MFFLFRPLLGGLNYLFKALKVCNIVSFKHLLNPSKCAPIGGSPCIIICYAFTADQQADSPPCWIPAPVHCRSLYWTILQANEEKAIPTAAAVVKPCRSCSPFLRLSHTLHTDLLKEPSSQITDWPKFPLNHLLFIGRCTSGTLNVRTCGQVR